MARCPNCGHDSPASSAYCLSCGAALPTYQPAPIQTAPQAAVLVPAPVSEQGRRKRLGILVGLGVILGGLVALVLLVIVVVISSSRSDDTRERTATAVAIAPPSVTPSPTATPVPPTSTPARPTATATLVPPTNTPVVIVIVVTPTPGPPTSMPVPPTATPVPPTATSPAPTRTPTPTPTATVVPPTATLIPSPTPTTLPLNQRKFRGELVRQDANNVLLGKIQGSVLDKAGKPIPGVEVELRDTQVPARVTDPNGAFLFDTLSANTYRVCLRGFSNCEPAVVPLQLLQIATVRIAEVN